jgi:NADPH2:quinone reductase
MTEPTEGRPVRGIQITEFGGPEVLTLTDLPEPEPQPGQLLVQVSRAGVNYADTHQAEDTYLSRQTLPLVPGAEVVGTTGDGRRVVALVGAGGYAERAVVSPQLAFDVPEKVSDAAALALVLQGLTAWHLLRTCAHLEPGESVVVHAAAGGVGSLAVQLAKSWGAGRVIAVASSGDKRDLALDLGADAAVDLGGADTVEEVSRRLREANDGHRVNVVLEMTGGVVFDGSLAAVAPFGRLITFGTASRQAPSPINPGALVARSQAVIGFWLAHCFNRPDMLSGPMAELMELTAQDRLRPIAGGDYPLSEARRAHEDMRARRTTGKLTLDPSS